MTTNRYFTPNSSATFQLSRKEKNNVEKVTKLMVDLIRRNKRLWRKEINDWQFARLARYNVDLPNLQPLDEVYDDIMMDGHLTGITENRTLRTVNKDFVFTIDGVRNDALTDYIRNKTWFENIMHMAHQSTYRGHSLIWIKEYQPGNIKSVELIPRGLVVPEQNLLKYQFDAISGVDFTTIDTLLYAQFYDNVGLLEKAAPYTILKRHSWGSWDEFEELYGVPIRIAKIASQSDVVKNEVADWLAEMGSAAYAVFPLGTEVDIKENSKTDAFRVFYMKIEALDKELSKLVQHQTMTTENGASKAQGNVHENTLKELIYADEKRMISFLNDTLVPAMRNLGYSIPENARIEVEATKDSAEQIKIDGELMRNGYILKQNYVEEVYGVEIESMPSPNTYPQPGKL